MANWTNIPDNLLEPGKPIRSVDGLALRDNPIALAEGAAGAPKITDAALAAPCVSTGKIYDGNVTAPKLATGTGERDWVGARYAALGVGVVGSMALMHSFSSGTASETRPGSALRYSNADGSVLGGTASGTWVCCGASAGSSPTEGAYNVTLWKRTS